VQSDECFESIWMNGQWVSECFKEPVHQLAIQNIQGGRVSWAVVWSMLFRRSRIAELLGKPKWFSFFLKDVPFQQCKVCCSCVHVILTKIKCMKGNVVRVVRPQIPVIEQLSLFRVSTELNGNYHGQSAPNAKDLTSTKAKGDIYVLCRLRHSRAHFKNDATDPFWCQKKIGQTQTSLMP
jgi:hypothetical protein